MSPRDGRLTRCWWKARTAGPSGIKAAAHKQGLSGGLYPAHPRPQGICPGRQILYGSGGRKKNDCRAVLLYESSDLENWRFCRELTVPMKFSYMWECPDLFCTGENGSSPFPQGFPGMNTNSRMSIRQVIFQVNGDFRAGCRLEDFRNGTKGFDFYAPQTFTDESGRTLLIAWAGLPDVEEEYKPH